MAFYKEYKSAKATVDKFGGLREFVSHFPEMFRVGAPDASGNFVFPIVRESSSRTPEKRSPKRSPVERPPAELPPPPPIGKCFSPAEALHPAEIFDPRAHNSTAVPPRPDRTSSFSETSSSSSSSDDEERRSRSFKSELLRYCNDRRRRIKSLPAPESFEVELVFETAEIESQSAMEKKSSSVRVNGYKFSCLFRKKKARAVSRARTLFGWAILRNIVMCPRALLTATA